MGISVETLGDSTGKLSPLFYTCFMLRAGTREDLIWDNGLWLILDIGFSSAQPTCCLSVGNDDPQLLTFAEVCSRIVEFVRNSDTQVNLVIEAPLSVTFRENGNPISRSIEHQNGQWRQWYAGAGAVVFIATQYLLKRIIEMEFERDIVLFEGFVSFNFGGDHCAHVIALRNLIREQCRHAAEVFDSHQLRINQTDNILSSGELQGVDFGIPAVLKPLI